MLREHIFHKLLRRAYRLHVAVDEGTGPTVVLLHGIAATALTYTYVIPPLLTNCRVIALEMLGFGSSPKPDWKDYSIADHADSVLGTLRSMRIRGPIILVGHSMGALIAVEVARRRPKLVNQLFLLSMPLYKTSTGQQSAESKRLDSAYERVYAYLLANPTLTLKRAEFVARYIPAAAGFELNAANWLAFERSLGNTIMGQHTMAYASDLSMPTHLYVGRLDPLVIKSYLKDFVHGRDHMQLTTVNAAHEITELYAKLVTDDIILAVEHLETGGA